MRDFFSKIFKREKKSPYVHLTIDDLRNKKVIVSYGNKAVFIGILTDWILSSDVNGDMKCQLELMDWDAFERRHRVDYYLE